MNKDILKRKKHFSLRSFLDEHRTTGDDYTHTGMGGYSIGKFKISDEKKEEFNRLYCSAVFQKNEEVSLTEKQGPTGPVVVDVDFSVAKTIYDDTWSGFTECSLLTNPKPFHLYSQEFVNHIVNVYLSWMKFYTTKDITAYVLERESMYEKGNLYKDGIHIVFPDAVLPVWVKELMYKQVLDVYEKDHPGLDWTNIIDENLVKINPWTMYGSTKVNCAPYRVSSAFIKLDGEDDVDAIDISEIKDEDFVDMLRIHGKTNCIQYKEDELKSMYDNVFGTSSKINMKSRYAPMTQDMGDISDDDRELVNDLIDILNPVRAEVESKWSKVNWCLYNTSPTLLDTWLTFSQKCPRKYNEESCIKRWNRNEMDAHRYSGCNIWTLHKMAKEDSPKEYAEIMEYRNAQSIRSLLLEGEDYDLARCLYILFNGLFYCTDIKKKSWFRFNGVIWEKDDNGVNLLRHISTTLSDKCRHIIMEYSQKLEDVRGAAPESEESEDSNMNDLVKSLMGTIKHLKRVQKSLKTHSRKAAIMHECIELFHDSTFLDKLDINSNLICFKNGVYDGALREFRQATKEDFCSLQVDYDYVDYKMKFDDETTWDNETRDMFSFLRKILPKKDIFDYVMKLLSSSMFGDSSASHQFMHFFIGEKAGNGKSTLMNFLRMVMGDYYGSVNITLFTKERPGAGAASPEIMAIKDKRLVMSSEPDKQNQLVSSFVKLVTGNDVIKARNLYDGKEVDIIFQAAWIILCNNVPRIDINDEGVDRRFRCIPFNSIFRFELDPNDPHCYLVDKDLKKKLPIWKDRFMYFMLNHFYDKYVVEDLEAPEEIDVFTNLYKNRNNLYKEFFNDTIHDEGNDVKDPITTTDMYDVFRIWLKDNRPSDKCPPRYEVKDAINKSASHPLVGNVWPTLSWKERE